MALNTQVITGAANHTAVQRLAGYSIAEDASAAAHIRLRVGSVSGTILADLWFAADESANMIFPKGIVFSTGAGVFVQEVSGSVEGTLYYPDY